MLYSDLTLAPRVLRLDDAARFVGGPRNLQKLREKGWVKPLIQHRSNTKLHIILRSDEDREIHDHPWTFITWMLAGGYYEATPQAWVGKTPVLRWAWVKPGTLRLCRAPYPHKLELQSGNPAVTPVFMFPRWREWGFYTPHGWVPWFKFESEKEC